MPESRANHLTPLEGFKLDAACAFVNSSLGDSGYGCFLVGSVLTRRDFRDVDVRFIMKDDEFARLFLGIDAATPREHGLWSLMCVAISEHLSNASGLRVDFQIQQMTLANANHPGGRSALGQFVNVNYPGGG